MEATDTEIWDAGRKRDERGRRIVGREERHRLVQAYRSSGLTQKAFCKREGIKYYTFVSWVGRLRQEEQKGKESSRGTSFREIVVKNQPTGAGAKAGLEVELPGGIIVRGENTSSLAELIQKLGSQPRC